MSLRNKKLRTYLSGGMEYASGEGADWRLELEQWLRIHLKHSVFNPNKESKKYLSQKLPDEDFRLLKNQNIQKYISIVRTLVVKDTTEIAKYTDYLICLWDESAQRGAGTKGELTIANFFRKPIYIVTQFKKEDIPGWVLGCATKFFSSFNELKEFLQKKYKHR